MQSRQMINPREAAFLALLSALQDKCFISESLENWRTLYKPSPLDLSFAQEIAYGSARMALALDYIGAQLSEKKSSA